MIFKVKAEWPWRYRSRSRVITCDTPSNAIDHLYQIWEESIKNCRCSKRTQFSRPRPNDLEDIGQGQRLLYATHPLILVIICAKYGKNPSRTVEFFFQGWGRKILKICQKFKFQILNKMSYATHPLMIVIICAKYKKNPSTIVDTTERTRFSKSRPNDLEDIGQGQGSSHATHPFMPLIICTKYGKNPSRTVDATERTRFSRPRPDDLEDIGQGQRSLYATHSLILVIICAEYGKNPSRTVEFFFQGWGRIFLKFAKNSNFQILKKSHKRHTL